MNSYSQNSISSLKQIVSGFKALRNFHLSDIRKVFSLMGKTEKIALLVFLIAAIASLSLSARGFYINHTETVPALGGELTEGILGQPQFINPLLATTETDLALVKLIFSGLYKYGPEGELVPDLADGVPTISEDQKSYLVSLKSNALWHNRQKVSADDVIFTINTLKNSDYKSPLRQFWLNTTVEKISDLQIKFINKDISGPFIHNLTLPIIPQNIWQNIDSGNFLLNNINQEAIGSGPYAITQINKLPSGKIQSIALKSFANFHGKRANIEILTIKFYDSEDELINGLRGHEIDLAGIVPSPFTDLSEFSENFTLIKLPLPQYQIAYLNLNDGLLAQNFLRRALNLATDQASIISEIFQNQRKLPIDPLTKQIDKSILFNLDEAKAILNEQGWILGEDGSRRKNNELMGLTITTSDSISNVQTGQILQKQWQELGITVNLDIKPARQLTEEIIRGRKFQVLIFSQKFGADPDPFFFWHSSQIKDPGLNLTGLSDSNLDKLLTEARNTTQTELRQEKYKELSSVINSKNPQILLNQSNFIYLINKDIKNLNVEYLPDQAARFYDFPNWYLETKREWK